MLSCGLKIGLCSPRTPIATVLTLAFRLAITVTWSLNSEQHGVGLSITLAHHLSVVQAMRTAAVCGTMRYIKIFVYTALIVRQTSRFCISTLTVPPASTSCIYWFFHRLFHHWQRYAPSRISPILRTNISVQ